MSMRKARACPECGTNEVMLDVRVQDLNESWSTEAQLTVDRNPDAIIFKERARAELRACVCAKCGHVELHVDNPTDLWDAYRASRKQGEP